MKVIAIVNRRGGVGKTATAHALGAGLCDRGYKVLFVDLDSQTNLTYDTGAQPGKHTSMDILTGDAKAPDTIIKTNKGDIIPASPALSGADILLTGNNKEYRLKEALQPLKDTYDYVVIDTPPALGTIAINALTASDMAVIPAQAEVHSLQGIGLLSEIIGAVRQRTNPDLQIDGILLTRYNGRAIISKDMKDNLEAIARNLNTRVYKTPIRECISIKEAQALRQDIFTYANKSNASKDYNAFIDELLSNQKPKRKTANK